MATHTCPALYNDSEYTLRMRHAVEDHWQAIGSDFIEACGGEYGWEDITCNLLDTRLDWAVQQGTCDEEDVELFFMLPRDERMEFMRHVCSRL